MYTNVNFFHSLFGDVYDFKVKCQRMEYEHAYKQLMRR